MTKQTETSWEEKIWDKYSDKGNEMYGLVKHNNTILQNIIDDFKEYHYTELQKAREEGKNSCTKYHVDIDTGLHSLEEVMLQRDKQTKLQAYEELESKLPEDWDMRGAQGVESASHINGYNQCLSEIKQLITNLKNK